MTGSKQVVHWTSETWWEWSEIAGSAQACLTGPVDYLFASCHKYPLGIWTWVPYDVKQTGSPLDKWDMVRIRVSSETSCISKHPKLEPKLVSALSETRRLFRFNIKTGSLGVSKQPKQTKDKPKQKQIC